MPCAWRCPKSRVAVTAICREQLSRGGSSCATQWRLGAGLLRAWATGRRRCSWARAGRVSVRRPCVGSRLGCAIRVTPVTDDSAVRRKPGPGGQPAGSTLSGAQRYTSQEAPSGLKFTALARFSKIRSQGVRLRCCQGNRAVPGPAGRRYTNFCLLAWETSEVAILDFPALETTAFAPSGAPASAPGGAPASGGHGPDLRARALSLPDAPGASGGRHHLILVPGKTYSHPPPACIPTSGWSQPNPASSPGPDSVGSSRPSFTLFSHCPACSPGQQHPGLSASHVHSRGV